MSGVCRREFIAAESIAPKLVDLIDLLSRLYVGRLMDVPEAKHFIELSQADPIAALVYLRRHEEILFEREEHSHG